MQISKDDVLKLLQDKGQTDQAGRAQQELPDKSTPTSTRTDSASSDSIRRSC
jgi:hypothetical protein